MQRIFRGGSEGATDGYGSYLFDSLFIVVDTSYNF